MPHRNLVFTSAGDNANLESWIRGRADFDLWITYYGHTPGRYATTGDYYEERRGSKFGNLKDAYETRPEVLARYDAVFVLDDDIVISAKAINRLFELRDHHDLWLLQPAFSPLGRISWNLTRVRRQCALRYTNFVEMACPMFRRDKLDEFMAVYDPALVSYGTDWWYMNVLGRHIEGKVAIVDAITCINPHTRSKGGIREIGRLIGNEQAKANWEKISIKYGLSRPVNREFGRIMKPIPQRWFGMLLSVPVEAFAWLRSAVRNLGAGIGGD